MRCRRPRDGAVLDGARGQAQVIQLREREDPVLRRPHVGEVGVKTTRTVVFSTTTARRTGGGGHARERGIDPVTRG
jgi:hypothetical protein